MLSALSLLVGFVVGAVAAAIVMQLALQGGRPQVRTEVTALWDLQGLPNPRLVLEQPGALRPPPGAKVIVPAGLAKVADDVLARCEVRTHHDVRENAALGDGRAILFTTQPRAGAVAVTTTDAGVLMKMEHDWNRLWKEAEPFAPTVSIVHVGEHVGGIVEVRGVDAGMTEYRGRQVLRVESDGHALPVLVKGPTGLSGQAVRVVGKVVRSDGMTYVDALKVMPLQRRTAATN